MAEPASLVLVWGAGPSNFQVTVVPGATVISLGSNAKFRTVTVVVVAGGPGSSVGAADGSTTGGSTAGGCTGAVAPQLTGDSAVS
jgi:hypothetical protein